MAHSFDDEELCRRNQKVLNANSEALHLACDRDGGNYPPLQHIVYCGLCHNLTRLWIRDTNLLIHLVGSKASRGVEDGRLTFE